MTGAFTILRIFGRPSPNSKACGAGRGGAGRGCGAATLAAGAAAGFGSGSGARPSPVLKTFLNHEGIATHVLPDEFAAPVRGVLYILGRLVAVTLGSDTRNGSGNSRCKTRVAL